MPKNQNIEKIVFKVVQMKFLAMHITNKKISFNIFTVGNLQNLQSFDLYNVFLATAANIPVLLKTGFVVHGHIFKLIGTISLYIYEVFPVYLRLKFTDWL